MMTNEYDITDNQTNKISSNIHQMIIKKIKDDKKTEEKKLDEALMTK